jgi:uncharacterized protein
MTDPIVPTPREVAELARLRLAAIDMSGFTDLFAEDAVFEYPFGYPGAPARLHGREEIRAHLVESRRDVASLIEVTDVRSVVHQSTDPEVVVFELEISGTNRAGGEPFRFASGVEVATVRDGLIVHYRDYTNILGAAAVTGKASAGTESVGVQRQSV